MEQPKIVCRIKGEYTHPSGDVCKYEYRVFETDTMAEFIRLHDYELKRHPNAKQTVIWEDNTI